METKDEFEKIKKKYQEIVDLKVKDRFDQLGFLVNHILELINDSMANEDDKDKSDFLFMKYSALTHTLHKEVGYVVNQPQLSRTVLLKKLKIATDQIYLDLLGLV